jgi:hypothetical protein
MPNPWERPPLPSAGNANPNDIYCAVGRVLSNWEIVELQLGYLYTAFISKPQNWGAVIEYGSGAAFKRRSQILERAAKEFFITHSNQRIEGEFDCLFRITILFGDRRHDIAHAIVRDESWARWVIQSGQPGQLPPRGYFILPTHYKRNRYDDNMLPEYAYNSYYLRDIEYHLIQLQTEIIGFGHRIADYSTSSIP